MARRSARASVYIMHKVHWLVSICFFFCSFSFIFIVFSIENWIWTSFWKMHHDFYTSSTSSSIEREFTLEPVNRNEYFRAHSANNWYLSMWNGWQWESQLNFVHIIFAYQTCVLLVYGNWSAWFIENCTWASRLYVNICINRVKTKTDTKQINATEQNDKFIEFARVGFMLFSTKLFTDKLLGQITWDKLIRIECSLFIFVNWN